jgi:hypothetical protein
LTGLNRASATLERTAYGRRSALRFALIVVPGEKLLEVMGDDVTQDPRPEPSRTARE